MTKILISISFTVISVISVYHTPYIDDVCWLGEEEAASVTKGNPLLLLSDCHQPHCFDANQSFPFLDHHLFCNVRSIKEKEDFN